MGMLLLSRPERVHLKAARNSLLCSQSVYASSFSSGKIASLLQKHQNVIKISDTERQHISLHSCEQYFCWTSTIVSFRSTRTSWNTLVVVTVCPPTKIMPSQMEVAPPHRTVDITQKRRQFKNTKETEKIQKE